MEQRDSAGAPARETEARCGRGPLGRRCGIRPHSVVLAAAVLSIQVCSCTYVRPNSSPRYSEREPGAGSSGSGPWALLARHGEKDEDNPGDVDLNQRGRIRAAAMAALLWPAEGTSRKDYAAPLPECLESSMPIALAAQVPDIHKIVRRCLETAQYFEQQAQKVAKWVKIAPFGVLDIDKLASWVWTQSLHTMGQPSSVSVTVWAHEDMHEVANRILNTTGCPKWPGDRYDIWWVVDLGRGTVLQYSHELLYGDAKDEKNLTGGSLVVFQKVS